MSDSSDNSRSAYSIVWGCLATIFTCTWVSVHPNIPGPKDNELEVVGRRLAIMVNMLVVPEFVILWTGRQYIASREIYKRHKARGWTKTHAFFAIMGGFGLHNESGTLIRILGIEELEELEKEGRIDWPNLTEEEIKDKSKGDYLSKAIVVGQCIWFIVQIIGRGTQHLAVTELEVVTLAFSVLTMVIYFLWWYKPLDVGLPVPVYLKPTALTSDTSITTSVDLEQPVASSSQLEDNKATTSTCSQDLARLNDETRPQHITIDTTVESDNKNEIELTVIQQGTENDEMKLIMENNDGLVEEDVEEDRHSKNTNHMDLDDPAFWPNLFKDIKENFHDEFHNHTLPIAILRCFIGVICCIIIGVIYLIWKPIKELCVAIAQMITCVKINPKTPTRVPTFYAPKCDETAIYLIIILVATVFGSIHCIAWRFAFPTHTEMLLWRISSIAVTSMPLGIFLVASPIGFIDDESGGLFDTVATFLFGILFILLGLAYVAARICLLVLPLIAFRALPAGAYADVDWTSFIPHIHV